MFCRIDIVHDEQLLLFTSFHCHLLVPVLVRYKSLGVVVSRGEVDGQTRQRNAKSEPAVTEKMHVDKKLFGEWNQVGFCGEEDISWQRLWRNKRAAGGEAIQRTNRLVGERGNHRVDICFISR